MIKHDNSRAGRNIGIFFAVAIMLVIGFFVTKDSIENANKALQKAQINLAIADSVFQHYQSQTAMLDSLENLVLQKYKWRVRREIKEKISALKKQKFPEKMQNAEQILSVRKNTLKKENQKIWNSKLQWLKKVIL
ncbi:MAG: hypothetical protein ABIJ91_03025 [Candidatus Kuenenbacteria bacterium]